MNVNGTIHISMTVTNPDARLGQSATRSMYSGLGSHQAIAKAVDDWTIFRDLVEQEFVRAMRRLEGESYEQVGA